MSQCPTCPDPPPPARPWKLSLRPWKPLACQESCHDGPSWGRHVHIDVHFLTPRWSWYQACTVCIAHRKLFSAYFDIQKKLKITLRKCMTRNMNVNLFRKALTGLGCEDIMCTFVCIFFTSTYSHCQRSLAFRPKLKFWWNYCEESANMNWV